MIFFLLGISNKEFPKSTLMRGNWRDKLCQAWVENKYLCEKAHCTFEGTRTQGLYKIEKSIASSCVCSTSIFSLIWFIKKYASNFFPCKKMEEKKIRRYVTIALHKYSKSKKKVVMWNHVTDWNLQLNILAIDNFNCSDCFLPICSFYGNDGWSRLGHVCFSYNIFPLHES